MKHTGIFVGEQLAEDPCFSPDKEVTRGEFVTMLVKALQIPPEEEVTYTGYTDDIPKWLQPYLAAAVRSGLTAGMPEQETFGAGIPITDTEVTILVANALDRSTAEAFAQSTGTPVTREDAALILYRTASAIDARGEADTLQ